MCRDPRDPHLVLLENNAINVVGPDWPTRLDKIFVENLGKFRKYDGRSVQDLLRALRNKVCVRGPNCSLRLTCHLCFVLFHTETPLSGPTRVCQASRRRHARRISLILYTPLPSPVPPCALCHRQLLPPPRVHVPVVLLSNRLVSTALFITVLHPS